MEAPGPMDQVDQSTPKQPGYAEPPAADQQETEPKPTSEAPADAGPQTNTNVSEQPAADQDKGSEVKNDPAANEKADGP